MRKALDFSNYDSNVPFDDAAVALFIADGFKLFILGCQNPALADEQAVVARRGGMRTCSVYIEPFTADDAYAATQAGIERCKWFGNRVVWAACEKGGVTGIEELRAIHAHVEAAGLILGIYTGKYTWQDLFQNTTEFSDCPLWFAAYWSDGHITSDLAAEGLTFGGWTRVAIHQYASTPDLAGRPRDRNMVLIEQEGFPMTDAERAIGTIALGNDRRMIKCYRAFVASSVPGSNPQVPFIDEEAFGGPVPFDTNEWDTCLPTGEDQLNAYVTMRNRIEYLAFSNAEAAFDLVK